MREAYVENGDMEISNIIKNSNMDNSDIAQGTLSIVDNSKVKYSSFNIESSIDNSLISHSSLPK